MNLLLKPRSDIRLLSTGVAMPVDVPPAGQRGVVLDHEAVLARMEVPTGSTAQAPDPQVQTRQWVQGADAIDLAVEAARCALSRAGMQAQELAAIVCASSTPVSISAAMAARVALRLGCSEGLANAAAFDVRAGGVGVMHAWFTAQGLIAQGSGPVLVVAAETPSLFLKPTDVGTALRYGDGAGACILAPTEAAVPSFLGGMSGQQAMRGRPTTIPGRLPPVGDPMDYRFQKPDREHLEDLMQLWARCPKALADAFPQAASSTRHVVPYSVSHQQMETALRALNVPGATCFHELHRYGCVGAASPLVALHGLLMSGQAQPGEVVCLISAAGNGVWGGFFWALDDLPAH